MPMPFRTICLARYASFITPFPSTVQTNSHVLYRTRQPASRRSIYNKNIRTHCHHATRVCLSTPGTGTTTPLDDDMMLRQTSMKETKVEPSTLYLVTTPIGNLGDMTPRALRVLQQVDKIYAEDTRVTKQLLSYYRKPETSKIDISSCHTHNIRSRIPQILSHLVNDKLSVAYVCDAGTPCISDPGNEILQAIYEGDHHARGAINIKVIPGVCAAVTALCMSGYANGPFIFIGFLKGKTKTKLQMLKNVSLYHSAVLYEAPHRLVQTLRFISDHYQSQGERQQRRLFIARELTKKYEQVFRFENIQQSIHHFESVQQPRGEFTIVLSACLNMNDDNKSEVLQSETNDSLQYNDENDNVLQEHNDVSMDVKSLIRDLVLNEGVSVNSVAKIIARSSNVPRKSIYSYATNIKQQHKRESGDG